MELPETALEVGGQSAFNSRTSQLVAAEREGLVNDLQGFGILFEHLLE
jgi:hypothetical protein